MAKHTRKRKSIRRLRRYTGGDHSEDSNNTLRGLIEKEMAREVWTDEDVVELGPRYFLRFPEDTPVYNTVSEKEWFLYNTIDKIRLITENFRVYLVERGVNNNERLFRGMYDKIYNTIKDLYRSIYAEEQNKKNKEIFYRNQFFDFLNLLISSNHHPANLHEIMEVVLSIVRFVQIYIHEHEKRERWEPSLFRFVAPTIETHAEESRRVMETQAANSILSNPRLPLGHRQRTETRAMMNGDQTLPPPGPSFAPTRFPRGWTNANLERQVLLERGARVSLSPLIIPISDLSRGPSRGPRGTRGPSRGTSRGTRDPSRATSRGP